MSDFTQLEQHLIKVANLIGEHFGPSTEIVVHDFKTDIDHSIIHIVNGEVTGRSTGDGPTPAFLRQLSESKKGVSAEKRRLLSNTADGRIIRSSTTDFFDDDRNLINAFCINQDVTKSVNLQNAISDFSATEFFETAATEEDNTTPSTISIHELMDNLIEEGIAQIGVAPEQMNKAAKLQLLRFLDDHGVFVIQKSGQIVCDLLGISKFTLYNYLDEVRGASNHGK